MNKTDNNRCVLLDLHGSQLMFEDTLRELGFTCVRPFEVEANIRARERAAQQAAKLRAQLAAARKVEQLNGNKDIVDFNVYFKAAQGELEKMGAVLDRLSEDGQSELVEKLKGTMAAPSRKAAELSEV